MVKTPPGGAPVVAAAIDDLQLEGVAGTIAGDDVVSVVAKDGRAEPADGPLTHLYHRFRTWSQEA